MGYGLSEFSFSFFFFLFTWVMGSCLLGWPARLGIHEGLELKTKGGFKVFMGSLILLGWLAGIGMVEVRGA